jgi:hypothetical protein
LDVRPLTRAGVDQFKLAFTTTAFIWGKSTIYLCKDPSKPGFFLIVDGNHRITALLELFEETKDEKYVSLLSGFRSSSSLSSHVHL